MVLPQASTRSGSTGSAGPQYTLARAVCLVGAVLAALAALVLCLGLLLWWAFQASEPSPLPWSSVAGMVLAGCIAGGLGWAGTGLTGRHPDRARYAGLEGAVLSGLAGVWIVLSPVLSPSTHGGGGWGEPWMPECAIGGVIVAYGAWLMWLLRPVRTVRAATPPSPEGSPVQPLPRDDLARSTRPSFVLAQVGCLVGIVLTVFGALLATFLAAGYDTHLARIACLLLAVCIIGCLGWAAVGLGGQHADRARRVGRVGAALGCLASVWIVVSRVWPVLSPVRGVGGALEYPIGGLTLAFGVGLWWLLRRRDL